ncbi:MAG: hypothetical protein ACFCU4_08630 [Puniceicoccaceae bacterium]
MRSSGSSGIPSVPKAPFILGDVVITVIAALLLFQNFHQLTIPILLASVFAFALGASLLALPFALEYKLFRLAARLESNQVSINVVDALNRTEHLIEKIEHIENQRQASDLLTEKLPALIEERLEQMINQRSKAPTRTPNEKATANPNPNSAKIPIEATSRFVDPPIPTKPPAPPMPGDFSPADLSPGSTSAPSFSESPGTAADAIPSPSTSKILPAAPEPATEKPTQKNSPAAAFTFSPPSPPKRRSTSQSAETPETTPNPEDPGEPSLKIPQAKATRLVITAFVGINNKIFLRGSGGGLNVETGIPLSITGIGEWEWKTELSEPIQCEVWLNDKIPASNHPITLKPGDKSSFQPEFE